MTTKHKESDVTEEATATLEMVKDPAPAKVGQFTLVPTTFEEGWRYAKLIADSQLCPDAFRNKPQDVFMAVQLGLEHGVAPASALRNIAVINGRPAMWGDLPLALVKASGLLERIEEYGPAEALEKGEGRCVVKRSTESNVTTRTFTMEQATTAGLIKRSGASGPWSTYPGRMLQMRARALALRDCFPDVLMGIGIGEEVRDFIEVDATAEPAAVAMPKRLSESQAEAQAPEPEAQPETCQPTDPVDGPEFDPETGEIVPSEEELEARREGLFD